MLHAVFHWPIVKTRFDCVWFDLTAKVAECLLLLCCNLAWDISKMFTAANLWNNFVHWHCQLKMIMISSFFCQVSNDSFMKCQVRLNCIISIFFWFTDQLIHMYFCVAYNFITIMVWPYHYFAIWKNCTVIILIMSVWPILGMGRYCHLLQALIFHRCRNFVTQTCWICCTLFKKNIRSSALLFCSLCQGIHILDMKCQTMPCGNNELEAKDCGLKSWLICGC